MQLALHELVARVDDPAKSGRVGDLSPAQLIDLIVDQELGQGISPACVLVFLFR